MSADNWTVCPKCGKDFREDYEIGVYEGVFEISYSGSCGTYHDKGCGYKYKYEFKDALK